MSNERIIRKHVDFVVAAIGFVLLVGVGLSSLQFIQETGRQSTIASSPDPRAAYTARAQLVTLRYVAPERGLFSSRDAFWEAVVLLEDNQFKLPVPPESVSSIQQQKSVPVMVIPCADRERYGICEVSIELSQTE